MLIRLTFYQIFILTSTLSISKIELKHYYYTHDTRMIVDYGADGHKNFTMFQSLIIDLLSDYYVQIVYFQFQNEYGSEDDIIVNCKGISPHSTDTHKCENGDMIEKSISFDCYCSTRFITVDVTRPFNVEYVDITGHELFSVLYAGCYESSLDGGYLVEELSECIFDCFRREHNLAGVKNKYCFCFDNFTGATVEYNLCNVSCLGLQICGSERHVMLYFTDYHSIIDRRKTLTTTECIKVANRCNNCLIGESGLNCDLKDCSSNNGLCGPRPCHQFEVDPLKGGSCQFRSGLQLINRTTFLDIDECKLEISVCREDEICINHFGAYICGCGLGHINVDDKCEDIDECLEGHAICDKNMDCINSKGSYLCKCLEGFREEEFGCKDISNGENRTRWRGDTGKFSYLTTLASIIVACLLLLLIYHVFGKKNIEGSGSSEIPP